jgi:prevent-host-death family protein
MKSYSTYEAKSKFSEILRRVRERGETVLVSYHGRPVAEIRPLPEASSDEPLAERVERLREAGVLTRAGGPRGGLQRVARRRGALRRFLAERDE